MYCTKCGNKLDINDYFCSNCGEKTDNYNQSKKDNVLRGHSIKFFSPKVIILEFLIIFVIGCIFRSKIFIPEYEKPVAYLVQAINKKDYETLKKAIPEFIWYSEFQNEWFEEEFKYACENTLKIKYKILGKDLLNTEDCKLIEENYEWYTNESVSVLKGYNLKIRVDIDGEINESIVTVVNIDGKWYLDTSRI